MHVVRIVIGPDVQPLNVGLLLPAVSCPEGYDDVLAILLERKRILKQVDIRESAEEKILIYEHVKTGEAFIINFA